MQIDLSFLQLSELTLVGLVVLISLYMGMAVRHVKLPALIGYMFVGVLFGPSVLNVLHETALEHLSFLAEVGLGFVAFTIGSELSLTSMKRLGVGIVTIIFAESFMALAVVTTALYFLTRDLPLAIIFGVMAPASAPAGTVAVIQECRARGSLTKALYAVVGFDDGLAVIIYGFGAALARNLLLAGTSAGSVSVVPGLVAAFLEICFSLALGGVLGLFFVQLLGRLKSSRDTFILFFGTVFLTTGIAIHFHLSLILANMMIGFVLANTRQGLLAEKVRQPLQEILPLVFILFFSLAGAHLDVKVLPAMGSIGVVYILGRTAGKIGGARLGATMGRVEEKIKKYLGLGLLSQAGVAIGLSLLIKNDFSQLAIQYDLPHAATIGAAALTTITATSVFFEIIGPICTRFALTKAEEIPLGEEK
ncbi:MAG: cation:proton antiporter [Desulfobulbaceae bacterium]|nr:cation:proton antiporter [Desulfobulbaceae bacterium]